MRRAISKRLISWASLLDDKALAQAERAASMPFVFRHLALMPDAHLVEVRHTPRQIVNVKGG
jgi:hypothetical protein